MNRSTSRTSEIPASTAAVPIDDSGNTSRGQYTLLMSDRFDVMLTDPVDTAFEKNVHGTSATDANNG